MFLNIKKPFSHSRYIAKYLLWLGSYWAESGSYEEILAWVTKHGQLFHPSSSSWGILKQSTEVFLWIDSVVTSCPTKSPKKSKCMCVIPLFPLQVN